jgi:hypothetical protein
MKTVVLIVATILGLSAGFVFGFAYGKRVQQKQDAESMQATVETQRQVCEARIEAHEKGITEAVEAKHRFEMESERALNKVMPCGR